MTTAQWARFERAQNSLAIASTRAGHVASRTANADDRSAFELRATAREDIVNRKLIVLASRATENR